MTLMRLITIKYFNRLTALVTTADSVLYSPIGLLCCVHSMCLLLSECVLLLSKDPEGNEAHVFSYTS
jgi:hypothetical protein